MREPASFTYNKLNPGLKVKVWSAINNDLSHLRGYMVSQSSLESLQELVRASSSSMLVTLNNVKHHTLACEIECHMPDYPSK